MNSRSDRAHQRAGSDGWMGGVKGKKTVMLRWKDSYLMGIEQFDHEHRQLFSLAESILKRVRERGHEPETRLLIVRESLIYLKNYFERHARQEEEYMRQIQYEGYGLHKQLHDSFHTMLQEKYQIIVDRGRCDREEILEFIGTGITPYGNTRQNRGLIPSLYFYIPGGESVNFYP